MNGCLFTKLSGCYWFFNWIRSLPCFLSYIDLITQKQMCDHFYLYKFLKRNVFRVTMKLTSFCVFIVNFEHISHIFLVFLLLNLNKQILARHILFFLKWISSIYVLHNKISSCCGTFHCHCLRSSHQRCSMWKGVLRNFAKFAGKHLC